MGFSGESNNFERGGEFIISPVVIYRNAHNELYIFYTGKGGLLKQF